MNLGLFMMPLHPPHRSIADSYDRDLELIALGDRLGYRECWVGEHITERWETAPSPELLIAKALAMTEHIVLGTGVTLLPVHHPAEVAHRIAMLDHLARGRFYWGIGIRALTTDLSLFGIDSTDPAAVAERSREALQVILGMWQAEDGKFDFDGKHFHVHATQGAPELERYLYMKPYQQPHPPIGVASTSPGSETIRLAGERGWIPMSSSNLLERDLFKHWELIREGAESSGLPPERARWRIARDIYVSESDEQAREEAAEVLSKPFVRHQKPNMKAQGRLFALKEDIEMTDDEVTPEYMMDHAWIVGGPETVASRLRHLYHQVGGFGTLLTITHDPDDHALEQRSLRLLAEEVAPRLADLTGE